MLVLLIIFMLMTMVMGRGKDLSLPKARYYSSEKDKLQPVLSIDSDGTLWLEKTKLGPVSDATLREMGAQVQAMWSAPKNPEGAGRIYIKADALVPFEVVKPVLLYLNRELGRQGIDLAIAKDSEAN
jgi:biopolymer transport protein ExbD/biopolymer transport protein TolR